MPTAKRSVVKAPVSVLVRPLASRCESERSAMLWTFGSTGPVINRLLVRVGVGRQALRDGASGLVVEGANLLGTLVFFALVSRRLGPSDFGSFSAMYGLIGISISLAYIGPGLAMLQHSMDGRVSAVSSSFFSIYLLCIAAAIGIVLSLSFLLLPAVPTLTVVAFVIAELVGIALVQTASALRLSVIGFRSTVPLQLVAVAIKVFCVVALSVTGHLSLQSYGITYASLCVVVGAVVFIKVTNALGVQRRLGGLRRDYLGTSVTISSTIWVSNFHNDGDKLVMSANRLGADVGLYAAAYRLSTLSSVPINAVVNSSYRSFLDPAVGKQFNRAIKYTAATILYAIVATGVIFFAAPIAIPLLAGDEFEGAVSIARWLAPLVIVRGFSHFPLNAIMGLGYPRARLVCICIATFMAMTMYVILIPTLSWKGAVIGSYVSDATLGLSAWVMLYRLRNRGRTAFGATSQPSISEVPLAQ